METLQERLQRGAREMFEDLKCVNYAMYFGCVDEVCGCGEEKCRNRQTVEMAEKEYTEYLNTLISHTISETLKEAVRVIEELPSYRDEIDGSEMVRVNEALIAVEGLKDKK